MLNRMRSVAVGVLIVISSFVVAEEDSSKSASTVIMPSILSSLSEEYVGLSYGASIKTFDFARDSVVSFASFEGGYEFVPSEGLHRFTVVGLSIGGLLNPGVMVELQNGEMMLYAVGEIDIFYFPFAFFSIALFEKPLFIPSLYIRLATDFSSVEPSGGIRISFPLYGSEES